MNKTVILYLLVALSCAGAALWWVSNPDDPVVLHVKSSGEGSFLAGAAILGGVALLGVVIELYEAARKRRGKERNSWTNGSS